MTGRVAAADGGPVRLATYGTLGPGRPNHHQLAPLAGQWSEGVVRGRLVEAGWGAALGYPALVLDEDGADIRVDVLTSADLPAHWARLDAFEGEGYARVLTIVRPLPASAGPGGGFDQARVEQGAEHTAYIYVLEHDSAN